MKKLLCYLIFWMLESLIILGSFAFVVCLYFPFVVLKAAAMTATGKATPKRRDESENPVASPNG